MRPPPCRSHKWKSSCEASRSLSDPNTKLESRTPRPNCPAQKNSRKNFTPNSLDLPSLAAWAVDQSDPLRLTTLTARATGPGCWLERHCWRMEREGCKTVRGSRSRLKNRARIFCPTSGDKGNKSRILEIRCDHCPLPGFLSGTLTLVYTAARSGCFNRQGFGNPQEDDSTVSIRLFNQPLFVPPIYSRFFCILGCTNNVS